MKKVLSAIACVALTACACDENQWEKVESVTFDDTVYEETAPVIPEETVVVAPEQNVVVPVQTPCGAQKAEAKPCPCSQYTYTVPQPCGCQGVVASKPKVTKTKKIITTTTTLEEPCGKPVCEPVVTTHEEVFPEEVSYSDDVVPGVKVTRSTEPVKVEKVIVTTPEVNIVPTVKEVVVPAPEANIAPAPVVNTQSEGEYVEVVVEKNPYRSEVVEISSSDAKANAVATAKYSPEAYIVVATRATNRMLQDTISIYDNGDVKTVYIKDTKLLSTDLPYGSHRLKGATKDIIKGSRTYEVVNNINNADFVLDTSADWYVSSSSNIPALQYKLSMYDKKGHKVNEWVEIIRQVQE